MIEPTTEPTTNWGTTLQRTYHPPGPPASEARAFKLGEEIALLSARIQAATYQLLVLLRKRSATIGAIRGATWTPSPTMTGCS